MAVFAPGNSTTWASEEALTNPSDTDVAADTGELAGGIYDIRVLVGGTAAAKWIINRRNAANGADVGDQPTVYTAANTSQFAQFTMTLEASERVRVTVSGNVTGVLSALITAERLV